MQVSPLDQLEVPLLDLFTPHPPGRGEALRPELPHTVRGLRQPQRLQIPREVQEQVSSRHSQSSLQNPSFGQLKTLGNTRMKLGKPLLLYRTAPKRAPKIDQPLYTVLQFSCSYFNSLTV